MTQENPTVAARKLGHLLRGLRRRADVSVEDAAKHIDRSQATMSRIENGRVGIRPRVLEELLKLYRAGEDDHAAALALARQPRATAGPRHGESMPAWFHDLVAFEQEARDARMYEAELVHGLLQTPEYARAVFDAAALDETTEDIEGRIAARMSRQDILTGETAASFSFVLNEAALRRPVGGAATMRSQLQRLVELSRRPNVALHVLPFAAGAHAGMTGPFTILQFPGDLPPLVYLDYDIGSRYFDEAEAVERYTTIFDHLRTAALTPAKSAAIIERISGELR